MGIRCRHACGELAPPPRTCLPGSHPSKQSWPCSWLASQAPPGLASTTRPAHCAIYAPGRLLPAATCLAAHQLVAALLKALDDVAHHPAVHPIRLDHDERALAAGGARSGGGKGHAGAHCGRQAGGWRAGGRKERGSTVGGVARVGLAYWDGEPPRKQLIRKPPPSLCLLVSARPASAAAEAVLELPDSRAANEATGARPAAVAAAAAAAAWGNRRCISGSAQAVETHARRQQGSATAQTCHQHLLHTCEGGPAAQSACCGAKHCSTMRDAAIGRQTEPRFHLICLPACGQVDWLVLQQLTGPFDVGWR